jgi:hypothetical protein
MNKQTGDPIDAFRLYTEAFRTLDPRSVGSFFNEPAIQINPRGVFALPNRAAVEQLYKGVMAELPAMGYARTDFSSLAERRLNDDLAVVSGSGAWKDASGNELQRFGMTYTLRRTPEAWLIVAAVIHEPEGA